MSRSLVLCLLTAMPAAVLPWGVVRADDGGTLAFGNENITASLKVHAGHLTLNAVENKQVSASLAPGELFTLTLEDGREIHSSAMRLSGKLEKSAIAPEDGAARPAARKAGQQLCADMEDEARLVQAHWCMIVRGNDPYLRQELTLRPVAKALPLTEVRLFHFHVTAAQVLGKIPGTPIVSGNFYLGFEHPLAYHRAENGDVSAGIKRAAPLKAEQPAAYSSVIGVSRDGQMRRAFSAYLELERAHTYRTFLYYDSWFDLGAGAPYGASAALSSIQVIGDELVRKRGVTVDSFLLDDGWDNKHSLWEANRDFPNGFTPVRDAAAQYGSHMGIWFSPWGGYGAAQHQRVAFASGHGYETGADGAVTLSGAHYYAKFEETCLNLMKQYGVNLFKFDGISHVAQSFPDRIFDNDFYAAIHLMERLRRENSDIFLLITKSTHLSPFWLRYADAVWRRAEDYDYMGEGSWRQKWITYRDAAAYRNIRKASPSFPLNSLMVHGIIFAGRTDHLGTDPSHDFAAEVHSYFGSGVQPQELYITPSLLSKADWDVLAESAKWSRRNASILRDSHFIGGNPASGQVYGWASWDANAGILVLRNPSSRKKTIRVDVQKVFELPQGAATRYTMRSPWESDKSKKAIVLEANKPHAFVLKPFEVMALESVSAH